MNHDSQFSVSLGLCLAALAILAAATVAVVAWAPRRTVVSAALPTAGVSIPAPGESTDSGSPIVDATAKVPATEPDPVGAEPVKAEQPSEPTESDEAPTEIVPETPTVPVETAVAGSSDDDRPARFPSAGGAWWIHSVAVRSQVFLLDRRDSDGVRRMFMAAPIDQRYAVLTVALTWKGRDARKIVLEAEPPNHPTLQLLVDGQLFDPLGSFLTDFDPLTPLTTDSLSVAPDSRETVDVVFLLPNEAEVVSMVLDGQPHDRFDLTGATAMTAGELVGVWFRLRSQLQPLRFSDPLSDALADPRVGLLDIRTNVVGFVELRIPSAAAVGRDLAEPDDSGAIALSLEYRGQQAPAWLRPLDGGAAVALYLSEDGRVCFVYEKGEFGS